MTAFSTATIHSIERTKERMGVNEKNAMRIIDRAIKKGKRAEDFASWERDYLLNQGDDGSIAIAYNDYCYIVGENGFCLTVFKLPTWFSKKKHFDGKERIRNMKTYSRKYNLDSMYLDTWKTYDYCV